MGRSCYNLGRETLLDREHRLRRLDLLLERALPRRIAGRQPAPVPRQAPGPDRRPGFTLVELLVVLAVILLLVGLSLSAMGDRLRRNAVDQGVGLFREANDLARQLALLEQHRDGRVFGVRLRDDGSGRARLTVVESDQGQVRTARAEMAEEPLFDHPLPASIVVWEADQDLRSGSSELVWFYVPGAGTLAKMEDGRLGRERLAVGLEAESIDRRGLPWLAADERITPPVLAPGRPGIPGLSVRSSTGDYGHRLAVSSSGLVSTALLVEPDAVQGRR